MASPAKKRSVAAYAPEQLVQKVDLLAERLERSKTGSSAGSVRLDRPGRSVQSPEL